MADRQDGVLLVQLAQWGTAMGLEDALQALWADNFDPEAASAEEKLVSRVLTYGETIGTLTKNGLLDTDLVLDWLWISGVWGRVAPAARKLRDKHGVPELYANFEALAATQAPAPASEATDKPWPGTSLSTQLQGQVRQDVAMVQSRLNDLGYGPMPVDGDYGPVTESWVRAYQSDNGLYVDGVVGPVTWKSLSD